MRFREPDRLGLMLQMISFPRARYAFNTVYAFRVYTREITPTARRNAAPRRASVKNT